MSGGKLVSVEKRVRVHVMFPTCLCEIILLLNHNFFGNYSRIKCGQQMFFDVLILLGSFNHHPANHANKINGILVCIFR